MADVNNDDYLDIYVANYPSIKFNSPNSVYFFKKKFPKEVETDKLYRNDGRKFNDVTKEA